MNVRLRTQSRCLTMVHSVRSRLSRCPALPGQPHEQARRGDPLRAQPLGRLCRLLDDGRIEIDSNTVERSIRPLALNRKNALFAGSDQGGDHWAVIASLIETCKLNRIDPQAWLSTTLTQLVAGHPASALDQLMPWTTAHDVA